MKPFIPGTHPDSHGPADDAGVVSLALWRDESGYTLAEFLVASLILILISTAVFNVLGETQQVTGCQTDIQEVLDNTRIAIDAIERHVRSAGNDPVGSGVIGISINGPSEIRIRSDLG